MGQLGIVVMVDVQGAINANTLEGNTYMFDNMKSQGSEGLGTGKLVSAINGTSYSDGSQANEQVLNWASLGVGSLPPTLPKTFLIDKSRNTDLQAFEDFKALVNRIESARSNQFANVGSVLEELKKISDNTGVNTEVQSAFRDAPRNTSTPGPKILDITGEVISASDTDEDKIPAIPSLNPLITGVSGEAVEKNIIYPGAYGSPDLVTDGWYWSATIDTSKPGIYAYTLDIEMYKLANTDGQWTWIPVHMMCDAYLKISNDPKKNGFTNAGLGYLPIPV